MEINVGTKEQKIRVAVGAVMLAMALFMHSWMVGLMGVVVLATGAIRFCPVYKMLGRSTNDENNGEGK